MMGDIGRNDPCHCGSGKKIQKVLFPQRRAKAG
ncbi:MAG: SEC-C domain-containing protein [Candidatus Omnitrophica bacterium]|nr:SEC-C domain-containing protein [Candidatus Omnitrophota bacterium]MBU4478361.1 SEC-C domain-containing protein [Candidatus Omnitrophota bacterium]